MVIPWIRSLLSRSLAAASELPDSVGVRLTTLSCYDTV